MGPLQKLFIFWYSISLVYCILAATRSIKDDTYSYEDSLEEFTVSCFIILFCWLVIPAELIYFFIKGEDQDLPIDSDLTKEHDDRT